MHPLRKSPLRRLLALAGAFALALSVQGDPVRPKPYTLAKRDGRDCLLAPDGTPFLMLGLSHVGVAVPKGETAAAHAERMMRIEANLRAWRFNTAPDASLWDRMPFIVPLDRLVGRLRLAENALESRFADVFDPGFKTELRRRVADACAKVRDNPRCIGYWWTDVPPWTLDSAKRQFGQHWVDYIRHLPETAPGRRRYAEFMAAPGPHDDRAFLRVIARELYAETAAAFRVCDSQRLLFGERYNGLNTPLEVIEEAARVVDVISLQPFEAQFSAEKIDAIHRLTGRPIVISDWNVSFKTPAYARTSWVQFPTAAAAAAAYEKYLTDAFATPYVIGYFKCGYIDKDKDGGMLKQGILRADGKPYEEFVARLTVTHERLIRQFVAEDRFAR